MADLAVAIVDDHPVVRLGLAALLASADGIAVVGEAATVAAALALLETCRPDVVVLDLNLPDGGGERVLAAASRLAAPPAVVVLTMEADDHRLVAALRMGARGYVLKGAPPDEVVRAIRAAATGAVLVGAGVSDHLAPYLAAGATRAESAFPQLTPREREVLGLLADGCTNDAIARRLGVRPKTARNLVSSVLVKLHARDRADAALRARAAGLGRPAGVEG